MLVIKKSLGRKNHEKGKWPFFLPCSTDLAYTTRMLPLDKLSLSFSATAAAAGGTYSPPGRKEEEEAEEEVAHYGRIQIPFIFTLFTTPLDCAVVSEAATTAKCCPIQP